MNNRLTEGEGGVGQPSSSTSNTTTTLPQRELIGLEPGKPTARQITLARTERAAILATGKQITLEDILERNGFLKVKRSTKEDATDRADAAMLRLHILPARQAALGIYLLGLEDGILRIAASGPLSETEKDHIVETLTKNKLHVEDVLIESWDRAQMARLLREQEEVSSERLVRTFAKMEKDPENAILVEQAVHDIFAEALQMRASDVHITYQEEASKCWIAYRVDGDLLYRHLVPPTVLAPIATRIKTDSKMDAAERRRPQDGRFSYLWQGRMIDVRAASLPVMPSGEKLTLRLLDQANLKSFVELFRSSVPIGKRIREKLSKPTKDGGFIIVSGPTGSGKSTTLYALVQTIDRAVRAVYEVAQPVEYEQHLASQVSITEGSSLKMADVVRAFLRHDPDTICIGEIRDSETVEAALRAVESGHMVMSTVHATSAENTLDRLHGFLPEGSKASGLYILGQYLTGILNQRLIRTLCPACKTMGSAGRILKKRCEALSITADTLIGIASEKGCGLCNGTGFLGRELLLEAIFAPESMSERRLMTKRILEEGLSSVRTTPGVMVHTRARSIRTLLLRGTLDGETAVQLLADLDGEGESEPGVAGLGDVT